MPKTHELHAEPPSGFSRCGVQFRLRRVGWEVIRAHEILARDVSDTQDQASEEADEAARNRTASCDLPSDGSASAS